MRGAKSGGNEREGVITRREASWRTSSERSDVLLVLSRAGHHNEMRKERRKKESEKGGVPWRTSSKVNREEDFGFSFETNGGTEGAGEGAGAGEADEEEDKDETEKDCDRERPDGGHLPPFFFSFPSSSSFFFFVSVRRAARGRVAGGETTREAMTERERERYGVGRVKSVCQKIEKRWRKKNLVEKNFIEDNLHFERVV